MAGGELELRSDALGSAVEHDVRREYLEPVMDRYGTNYEPLAATFVADVERRLRGLDRPT